MLILLSADAGASRKPDTVRFLDDFIRSCGIRPRIETVHSAIEVSALTRKAVSEGEELVVAGGGDGTIGAAAAELIDTNTALGVLPLGTLNHFAKDIGIPLDLAAAAHTLMTGQIAEIDAGSVNGRVFVNNSSLGVYPSIVIEREERRRNGWNKWTAFASASLTAFRRMPLVCVRLEIGGKRIVRTTPFVFVGNNEYQFEPPYFGGRRRLDAGLLWLYAAPHRPSRWDLIRLSAKALLGRIREGVSSTAATEFWVETDRKRIRAALDGEVVSLIPPLHYRVHPRALRVVVPAPEQ